MQYMTFRIAGRMRLRFTTLQEIEIGNSYMSFSVYKAAVPLVFVYKHRLITKQVELISNPNAGCTPHKTHCAFTRPLAQIPLLPISHGLVLPWRRSLPLTLWWSWRLHWHSSSSASFHGDHIRPVFQRLLEVANMAGDVLVSLDR